MSYTYEMDIRVRYAETDRMGYVYYGNYATYLEVARVELIRSLGFRYKDLEDSGIILPVLHYQSKFIKPAYYDQLIRVKTVIPEMPASRITFDYELFNEEGELLNLAQVVLVFIKARTRKPARPPKEFIKALEPWFT